MPNFAYAASRTGYPRVSRSELELNPNEAAMTSTFPLSVQITALMSAYTDQRSLARKPPCLYSNSPLPNARDWTRGHKMAIFSEQGAGIAEEAI